MDDDTDDKYDPNSFEGKIIGTFAIIGAMFVIGVIAWVLESILGYFGMSIFTP